MPSFTVNICVLTLVLLSLQQICLSRPHSRSKRGLIKHYFDPDVLVFSSDQFEKGEDGKYRLKKSSHKTGSLVKYALEDKDNVLPADVRGDDIENISNAPVEAEDVKSEVLKEELIETLKAEEALLKPNPPDEVEVKIIKEDLSKPDAAIEEKTGKVEKAPFTPVDPKFAVPPKPDSKDEIPLKTDLPPLDVEEKADEKITIGQFPYFYPHVMPAPDNIRLPILIPVRKVTYGAVSVIPMPPAETSDRLPLSFEDDIVGEGPHETESEEVSKSIAKEKKDPEYNPLMGIHLPFLSFRTFFGDLKETNKQDIEKQSKVVDVLGKKFLMQSRTMKHPTGDNSNMYVRFMSVKPLEEIKPDVPKEAAAEVEKSVSEEAKRKEAKETEMKKDAGVKEAEILEEERKLKEAEILEKERKLKEAEAEILKAEETQIKMKVNQEVPKEVFFENKGDPGVEENPENLGTKEAAAAERKMYKTEGSVIASEESVIKEKEAGMEEAEGKLKGEIFESRLDFDPKEGYKNMKGRVETDEETVDAKKGIFLKEDGMKFEPTDLLKREDAKKATDMDIKKPFFLLEKNKKQKSLEESEEDKNLKKNEKKKKCKCEEKDSDADEDDE